MNNDDHGIRLSSPLMRQTQEIYIYRNNHNLNVLAELVYDLVYSLTKGILDTFKKAMAANIRCSKIA